MSSGDIEAEIFRFDPSKDQNPKFVTYSVPRIPGMIIGDVLNYIYEHYDGTLAYRWECRTGQCGTCTIVMNGKPALICKEPVADKMRIQPLPFLPVIRDLVVDRSSFYEQFNSITSFSRNQSPTEQPEAIDPARVKIQKNFTQCCYCLACVVVCPVADRNQNRTMMPALLNRIIGYAIDERDATDRSDEAVKFGAYDCVKSLRCVQVCPHEIPIPKIIDMLRTMKENSGKKIGPI